MEHDNNYVDLALCQVLGYVSGHNRAGEQYREAGLPIPDTRATFVPTRLLQRSLLYRTVRKTAMHGDSEGRTTRTLWMP